MGFSLPTFNIIVAIYPPDMPGVAGIPTGGPRLSSEGNLAWGRRVNVASSGGTGAAGVPISCITLLLPPGTDIRGPQDLVSFDMVEAPAGSHRWYWVAAVDDIGKGFPNEHRAAVLFALASSWPAPYL